MKTIFRYLPKAVVLCILSICCTSCEFDTATKPFGKPDVIIYAPNTTIAVENIQIEKCYDQKTHRAKTYTARTYTIQSPYSSVVVLMAIIWQEHRQNIREPYT